MWEAVVRAPYSQTAAKKTQLGEGYHGNRQMSALAANSEWHHPRPWAKAPSCKIRNSRVTCSRDMSPICSDASDTEHLDRSTWRFQPAGPMVPPPPPPPPPDQPPRIMHGGSPSSSKMPAMHISYPQQPAQLAIPLPPAEPPNAMEGFQAPGDTEMPPTPPWRRSRLSSSYSPCTWDYMPSTAHFFLLGKRQQQSASSHPHGNVSLVQPLEDPYGVSGIADPYAHSTGYNGSKTCSNVTSQGTVIMQQLEPVAKLTANAPVNAASESCVGVPNNVALLLPPPLPHKVMAHAHAPPGRPGCSNYTYHPVAATAPTSERDHWLPAEPHRMRQRLRPRQRPEGTVSQGGPGGLPPFPFSPHCYYPPQQHHQQQPQPDRALLALRRTCYRCRKRGHEASECPNGNGIRQTRLDT